MSHGDERQRRIEAGQYTLERARRAVASGQFKGFLSFWCKDDPAILDHVTFVDYEVCSMCGGNCGQCG